MSYSCRRSCGAMCDRYRVAVNILFIYIMLIIILIYFPFVVCNTHHATFSVSLTCGRYLSGCCT